MARDHAACVDGCKYAVEKDADFTGVVVDDSRVPRPIPEDQQRILDQLVDNMKAFTNDKAMEDYRAMMNGMILQSLQDYITFDKNRTHHFKIDLNSFIAGRFSCMDAGFILNRAGKFDEHTYETRRNWVMSQYHNWVETLKSPEK
jgi:hypothetical protein